MSPAGTPANAESRSFGAAARARSAGPGRRARLLRADLARHHTADHGVHYGSAAWLVRARRR